MNFFIINLTNKTYYNCPMSYEGAKYHLEKIIKIVPEHVYMILPLCQNIKKYFNFNSKIWKRLS